MSRGLCRLGVGITMETMRSSRNVVAVCVLVASVACNRFASDPSARVIALVGGQPLTVGQLSTYLDANQFQDPAAEPPAPGDLARVKSRLFDDFLDG